MSDDAIKDYLAAIRDITVLTRAEVRELGAAIEVGVLADERLRTAAPCEVAPDLAELRRRGWRAERRLVRHNLKLVVSLARRTARDPGQLGDLIQAGNAGLVTAVRRFDWQLGFAFSTYATWWIKKTMSTEQANDRTIRLPATPLRQVLEVARMERELTGELRRQPTANQLSEVSGLEPERIESLRRVGAATLSLEQPLWSSVETTLADVLQADSPEPADVMHEQQLVESLASSIVELDPTEAQVVRMRYGFCGDRPRTVRDVAAILHLRVDRVAEIEQAALAELQRRLHHLV